LFSLSLIVVDVQEGLARVGALDPLKLNDLLQDAPEPPAAGAPGLKPVGANLLYLFERLQGAVWNDPQQRLLEARAHRFVEALHRQEPTELDRAFPFQP